ncbi:trypsin-like peptidase domain-containing protein [Telmatocola sphagniphila]|nr:trypsin-like peptidase domain-containing protein [Telmatocola sphagniphila]
MKVLSAVTLPRRIFLSACFSVIAGLVPTPIQAQNNANRPLFPQTGTNPRRTACVEVAEKCRGAVVNIHSERTISAATRDQFYEQVQSSQRVNGMGTGIVIDPRGYVITNHHVVDDVQLLRVRLTDGSNLLARVVARDPENDLALLKIDPAKPLPTIPLGTATDLMDGEPVIAIGNAFGYEHTITTGIVSAQKRNVSLNKEVSYRNLIQTDASINPGNSGGPLLNVYGELIGVNVAIRAGAQGIGFTIPVDQMINAASDMISLRRRTGIIHGLGIRNMLDASQNPIRRWALVDRCDAKFPGAEAGLQIGDVIDRVGEFEVKTNLDFERALIDIRNGEKLVVLGRRGVNAKGEGGAEFKLELVLKPTNSVNATAVSNSDIVWKKLGIRVQPANVETVTKVNAQLHGGMTILEVNTNSPAAKAGLQRGDILIGLHQWETITSENIQFVLTHPDLNSFTPLRYHLIRNGKLQPGWFGTID